MIPEGPQSMKVSQEQSMRTALVRRSGMLRITLALGATALLGTLVVAERLQQGSTPAPQTRAPQTPSFDNVEIKVLPVQGNIYMLVGAGGNITLSVGDEGVLLVDTQYAPLADKILAAIRGLSKKPIRYIINTHVHGDHTGGNEKIAAAGATIAGGNVVGNLGESAGQGAAIIAHENVLNRMSAPSGSQAEIPFGAWPTDTFFTNEKELFFNGEGVQVLHQPAAHTDGDSIVFFRRSDVIATGDLYRTDSYPVIDLQKGGSVQGVIDGLNLVLDLAVPEHHEEGGTFIIPGHGRISDEFDLVEYRDMVTIIRDRISAMITKGMTLDQVKAARPTLDYDSRFGAATGAWTTDMFVEAVFRSLKSTS
jgi:cyclase